MLHGKHAIWELSALSLIPTRLPCELLRWNNPIIIQSRLFWSFVVLSCVALPVSENDIKHFAVTIVIDEDSNAICGVLKGNISYDIFRVI
jgi:hypothetical protein